MRVFLFSLLGMEIRLLYILFHTYCVLLVNVVFYDEIVLFCAIHELMVCVNAYKAYYRET